MSNEFDFASVTKHLDITPVVEAPDGISQFRINKTPPVIEEVRDIKKIHYQIRIPASIVVIPGGYTHSYVALQYNYSVGTDFFLSIKSAEAIGQQTNSTVCIRYRIGNTAYRYYLGPRGSNSNVDDVVIVPNFYAPKYNGQLIKANFVIEFWTFPFWARLGPICGTANDLYLITSKLKNPAIADEQQAFLNDGTAIIDELYVPFPEIQTAVAWLDNT